MRAGGNINALSSREGGAEQTVRDQGEGAARFSSCRRAMPIALTDVVAQAKAEGDDHVTVQATKSDNVALRKYA